MNEVISKLIIETYLKRPIFWIIIIILGILSILFYKKIRGSMGEFWTKLELNKLPKDKYIVLNDILIQFNNGTSQIDHIVISKFGIFVIETKNYFGLIIGDEYKDKWTQHLGKNKYYFNNPIHQNYGHIKSLEILLNLENSKFISIICISNQANLKVKSKNVVQLDNINQLIKSYKEEILTENLKEIKNKIETNNILDKELRKNHVKVIKSNLKSNNIKENNMICPKCGGYLVERNGKYGKFIGCSNYPKCKYTIKKLLNK